MFTKKKPLMFTKTSAKPGVENAADAKEDVKPTKKKGKGSAFFANKAAAAFVKK